MAMLKFDGDEFDVSEEVSHAVGVLKSYYGAKEGARTKHEVAPRVVFDLPGGQQVMVPFNKTGLVVVLADRTARGASMQSWLAPSKIKSVYPAEDAGTFLKSGKATALTPSARNKVLRLQLTRDELRAVLDHYAGVAASVSPDNERLALESVPAETPKPPQRRAGRTLEELLAQLDRNSATGRAGEVAALAFEINRLRAAACPDPEAHVHHVALTDTGMGFDIQTTWAGQERCIEVKSTTQVGSDIYLSSNELEVLEALADKAWLYRVLVRGDGTGSVIGTPMQNPVPALRAAGLTTAVWRASDPVASE